MNAKTVLKKLVELIKQNEVELTYAKLKDGTIVESATFDVGEPIFVVSEDGTKTPAPDGEHELSLKDESGNENLIKVIVKDGVIAERENVELADAETKEAEDLPNTTGTKEIPTEMAEERTYETAPGDIPTTGDGQPAGVDQGEVIGTDGDIAKQIEKLAYRIEELEKKIAMQEEKPMEEVVDKEPYEEVEEDEELPKLNGAPTEAKKFSALETKHNIKRELTPQERVLERLYK